jgi:hypothetical protein
MWMKNHMSMEDGCSVCDEGPQSVIHVLRDCVLAQKLVSEIMVLFYLAPTLEFFL